MTGDIQFEFMEFKPDGEIKDFILSVADKLQISAPSDSAMKMAIRKSRDMIQASCQIVSQAGTFVAEAMSDNPIKAVQKIERRIRKQLDAWKAQRF
jgi:ribosome-associated translation inhibitor RaiA